MRDFCITFIPVPGTSCEFCTARAIIPGVRLHHILYPPGASVSSVRPCHNTRNFFEFLNTSIPVPETSDCSVRLTYPYPESTNPTEHNLVIYSVYIHIFDPAQLKSLNTVYTAPGYLVNIGLEDGLHFVRGKPCNRKQSCSCIPSKRSHKNIFTKDYRSVLFPSTDISVPLLLLSLIHI